MADRRFTTADFEYQLPDNLIAQQPSEARGDSRLLVVDRNPTGSAPPLQDRNFHDLIAMVPSGDLLIVNSTKVRHARLLGTRPGGGAAEVLLLHPLDGDRWLAMGKPGSALRVGKSISLGDGVSIETTAVQEDGYRQVRFVGASAAAAIKQFGQLPLPPYINRDVDQFDESRYQTVYASREGSVAAPTAGLHFTSELMLQLTDRGVETNELDLEVGPGTFRPVEVSEIADHPMHVERYDIPASTVAAISEAKARGASVWAVGTTVVRALESAARPDGSLAPGPADTRLLITPGYEFKVVDHLITNFHLPRSTLLMLVAAFTGYDLAMSAYYHAVANQYRFYSYGDAMCIL
jgi:S-adenosylmethionine:tRNA ribosyltransferase-isomerase